MLISARATAPTYKALEKSETRAMEAALSAAIATDLGETFATTLLTRPANPMRSSASWFLALALSRGGAIADDGIGLRVNKKTAENLLEIADLVWTTDDTPSRLLLIASDGSAVVGRDDPDTDDLLFLPLALQLRGTLKDKAGTSVKQVYRVGDGWRKPQGIFLSSNDAPDINLLDDTAAQTARAQTWARQIAIEMQALFDYQAARPMTCADPSEFETTRVPLGMNMVEEVSPGEMAFLCRPTVRDSDRHMGYRSFSVAEQALLEKALDLAITAHMPQEAGRIFGDYEIALIAGSPYSDTKAHIKADAMHISACLGPDFRGERTALLEPVDRALAPLLDHLRPEAMVHNRADIKASWTIARVLPTTGSNHDRLKALRELEDLIAKVRGTGS